MARTKRIALIVSAIAMAATGALQPYAGHQREIRAAAQKKTMENLRKPISELDQQRKGHR